MKKFLLLIFTFIFLLCGYLIFRIQVLRKPNQATMDKILRSQLQECKNCFPSVYVDDSFPKVTCKFGITNIGSKTISTTNSSKTLTIMVFSEVDKKMERNLIRNTWGKFKKSKFEERLEVIFVVGTTKNPGKRKDLVQEIDLHKDIVVADFNDTYRNLTIKTVFSIRWAVANCQNVDYIMKTDQDMLINIYSLFNYIDGHKPTGIFGDCFGPIEPIRDKRDKWYTPIGEYGFPYFPQYCSGTGYVMNTEVARKLVQLSPRIKMISMEDVYVSLLASKLGVPRYEVGGFYRGRVFAGDDYFCDCMITAHEYTFAERSKISSALLGRNCTMKNQQHCLWLKFKSNWFMSLFVLIVIVILLRVLVMMYKKKFKNLKKI